MSNVVGFTDKKTLDQEAAEWLIRLDGDDELSAAEREQLEEWLRRSPAHRERLRQLARSWSRMNVLTELAVPLGQETGPRRMFGGSTAARHTAIAATLVIGVALGAFYLLGEQRVVNSNGTYATAIGQQRSVELADGSVVRLNTNSQIRVDYGPATRDVALLRGEALFTVSKDPTRPFRVTAGFGEIRAVGTAFSVYLRGDAVDVVVSEGIVTLAAVQSPDAPSSGPDNDAPASVALQAMRDLGTLQAGQTGTISSSTNQASERVEVLENIGNISSASLSRRLAWTEGVLSFSGEPLDRVVEEISRYTTARIEIADPEVAAIRIGGRFPVGETDTMLETLENTFGLKVSYLPNGRVLISAGDK